MHLRMQDDQIDRKFMGLAPADMATTFNRYKNSFSSKRPSPSAGTTPTFNLAFLTRQKSVLYIVILLLVQTTPISLLQTKRTRLTEKAMFVSFIVDLDILSI
jgi:hypothetical protein